jgi:ecotin
MSLFFACAGQVTRILGLAMLWLSAAAIALAVSPMAEHDPEAVKNLETAYPRAPDGMERKVILLPKLDREAEDDHRVEIVVGKVVVTDGVNIHRFGGELREVDIPGWGFSFWQADGTFDAPLQTRIAGPQDPASRFVAGPSQLVRYNSRLPLVVMVPAGCEVRWRVWTASRGYATAKER